MNETTTSVRGTVITDPRTRRVGDDQVFSFRVASNTRYLDRQSGEWKTGGTLYFSANCWGRLAQRAAAVICKGDGVIVHGRLLTNEYEKEGHLMRDLEMRVTALGPDLARMDVSVKRAEADSSGPTGGVGLRGMEATDGHAMEVGSQELDDPEANPEEAEVAGEFVGAGAG